MGKAIIGLGEFYSRSCMGKNKFVCGKGKRGRTKGEQVLHDFMSNINWAIINGHKSS